MMQIQEARNELNDTKRRLEGENYQLSQELDIYKKTAIVKINSCSPHYSYTCLGHRGAKSEIHHREDQPGEHYPLTP